jgi:hypothetical protein
MESKDKIRKFLHCLQFVLHKMKAVKETKLFQTLPVSADGGAAVIKTRTAGFVTDVPRISQQPTVFQNILLHMCILTY